jgi:UDP-glucose 4-epimerase
MEKMVLVTGGLGYIGSHTVVKLIENNYDVIIIDNLSNSDLKVLDKIKIISNTKPKFYLGDINDKNILNKVFEENKITDVIHFAALKSVYESTIEPLKYFENNVSGTVNLLSCMKNFNIKNLIFSSSCTVYGDPINYPVNEETPLEKPKTPYGLTKSICETIIEELKDLNSVCLRYFNPIGNHKTGIIYENPKGVPENLMPYIIGVLKGEYEYLKVFGNDYDTLDGTAIRDYIDVNDLADAHVKSLDLVNNVTYEVINVGTGNGYSVMEIIKSFENKGYKIPYKIYPRRNGDIEKIWSDTSKSKSILNWSPKNTISDSIESILKSLSNFIDK